MFHQRSLQLSIRIGSCISHILIRSKSFPSRFYSSSTAASNTLPDRVRRSIFYVPGSDERKVRAALKLKADCIVYDLEDSVPLQRKGIARQLVFDALENANLNGSEKSVRINSVGSGQEIDDLNVILRSKNIQSIVIPKVSSAKEIEFVARMVDTVMPASLRTQVRFLASVESALGILNLREIANADPRIDALIFAAEDYCADTGLLRTPSRTEMLYARQAVVTTACAFELQSIDLVCVDYKDTGVLTQECTEGRQFGFTGKQAIHPAQVDIIQDAFRPAPHDLERAQKIMSGYTDHLKKGIGAFNIDGKMVDMPVIKWAQRLIAREEQIKKVERFKDVNLPVEEVHMHS